MSTCSRLDLQTSQPAIVLRDNWPVSLESCPWSSENLQFFSSGSLTDAMIHVLVSIPFDLVWPTLLIIDPKHR